VIIFTTGVARLFLSTRVLLSALGTVTLEVTFLTTVVALTLLLLFGGTLGTLLLAVTGKVTLFAAVVASESLLLLGGGSLGLGAVTGIVTLFTAVVAGEGFLLSLGLFPRFILAIALDVALLTTVVAGLRASTTSSAHAAAPTSGIGPNSGSGFLFFSEGGLFSSLGFTFFAHKECL